MHVSRWKHLLLTGAVSTLVLGPAFEAAAMGQYRVPITQGARRHQETAYARGYEDGYRKGVADGRRGDRYDPAESREYRDADGGYTESYGSRDAYRTNYRAGFRQGYEDGYRAGTR
jgi:flagellar biosynthesis/type III secretory pathway protein FliH